MELVHRNVAALADPPRLKHHEVDALSPEQARAVLAAVAGHRLQAPYEVALLLGLRQSEVLGLQWRDIDLDGGTLRVARTLHRHGGAYHLDEPKTARGRRTLPLPDPLVASPRRHRAQQLEERLAAGPLWGGGAWGDLVFATSTGAPLNRSEVVTKRFPAIPPRMCVPRMTFHELRHGAATLMLALGSDPPHDHGNTRAFADQHDHEHLRARDSAAAA